MYSTGITNYKIENVGYKKFSIGFKFSDCFEKLSGRIIGSRAERRVKLHPLRILLELSKGRSNL